MRRNPSPTRWAVLGALLGGLCSGPVPAQPALATLREIPEPATEQLEEDIQAQLERARENLDAVLAASQSPEEIAGAYGRLGQLYYLYDLTDAARICLLNARDTLPGDPRWHYYVAAIDQLEGDLDDATEGLRKVLEIASDDRPSLIRLGDVSITLGEVDAAQRSYRRALELDASSAAAHAGLGRVAALRKKHAEAVRWFEQALELQPAATTIHHQLGMSHRALGNLEEARNHLKLNTGGMVKFKDPLVQDLGRLLKSSQIFFKAGVDAARQGRYREAIAQFKKAAEEQPEDALIFYNLGMAELRDGQRANALADLNRSVELDPNFRNGHFNLGMLMAEEGRLLGAERHFRRAHEIDVEDLDAHLEWVATLSRLERTEEARVEIGKLLERDPENSRAHLSLGILAAVGGRRAEAVAELGGVLASGRARVEDRAEAHHQLALLSERDGDLPGAEAHYREAAALETENPDRLEALARSQGRLGDFAEAASTYGRTLTLAPQRSSAHFGRAMALLLAENYAEARVRVEESLVEQPTNVELAHLLARVMATAPDERVRDGERARQLAERLFDAAPSLERAETVAMALAELARYEEAIDWQGKVIAQLERAGDARGLAPARERLELYRAGRPCRSPWLGSGG